MSEYRVAATATGWAIVYPNSQDALAVVTMSRPHSVDEALTLVRLANAGLAAEPKEPDYHAIAKLAFWRSRPKVARLDDALKVAVNAAMLARDEWEIRQ